MINGNIATLCWNEESKNINTRVHRVWQSEFSLQSRRLCLFIISTLRNLLLLHNTSQIKFCPQDKWNSLSVAKDVNNKQADKLDLIITQI